LQIEMLYVFSIAIHPVRTKICADFRQWRREFEWNILEIATLFQTKQIVSRKFGAETQIVNFLHRDKEVRNENNSLYLRRKAIFLDLHDIGKDQPHSKSEIFQRWHI
jgi:hypothetical protein